MPVSSEDLAELVLSPIHQALDKEGITVDKLVKQAKAELQSKTTKIVKVKGATDGRKLPRGYRKIVTSGVVEEDKEGESFGDGDTLIESSEINWTTRQKARMDMHKLRGDYPAEKHEVKLNEESLNALFRGLPEEFREAVRAELDKALSGKRN